jgi:uncharacterized membrane protein
MKSSFIKSTIIGGFVFLVPIAVLLVIIRKLLPLLIKVDQSFIGLYSGDSILGGVAMHLVALIIVLLVSFLVGLAAQSDAGRKFTQVLEETILGALPGYNFFKGFTRSMKQSDEIAEEFTPVVVRFDDYTQMGFEIERIESNGKVVVYVPGAPNPWSGAVCYIDPERVQQLDITVPQAVRTIKMLGKGTSEIRDATVSS